MPRSKFIATPLETPVIYDQCPTVAEYSRVFLDTHVAKENKAQERDKKRQVFTSVIVPMLGTLRLDEITASHIDLFQAAQIKAGLSPKTVNNRLAILAKMLRFAQSRQVLKLLPLLEPLKVEPVKHYFLSVEKVRQLLEVADEMGPLVYGLVAMAVNTGMRKSELQALKWANVSLARGEVRVVESLYCGDEQTPKSRAGTRTIPLNRAAIAALKGVERLGPVTFSGPPRGAKLTNWFMHSTMQELKRRSGLRKCGWHVLRHTFASHMAMAGVPMVVLRELMGHSDIKMTMRYVGLSPQSKSSATDALSDIFLSAS